jgi:hypothetical protein
LRYLNLLLPLLGTFFCQLFAWPNSSSKSQVKVEFFRKPFQTPYLKWLLSSSLALLASQHVQQATIVSLACLFSASPNWDGSIMESLQFPGMRGLNLLKPTIPRRLPTPI